MSRFAAQTRPNQRSARPFSDADPSARPRAAVGNQALLRRLQPKLIVGAVDDPLEREADAVADQVMRMPAPGPTMSASTPRISRKCAECEEKEKAVRMKRAGGDLRGEDAPAAVDEVLGSAGGPLDAETRAFFEPKFGADFSNVRVHDDSRAARSAERLGARAYTVGAHIAFASGGYAPHGHAGRALLAHELAHTIQQGAAAHKGGTVQRQLNDPPSPESPPTLDQAPTPAPIPAPTPLPAGPPAQSACLPVIANPKWTVAPGPSLSPAAPCLITTPMAFTGTVSMPTNCPGTVYFVQYAKLNRSLVTCDGSQEAGACLASPLGLDSGWPYAFGGRVNTDQDPGSNRPIVDNDIPGFQNISSPASAIVRLCQDDTFTAYIVFEDKAGKLTSLGWMSWSVVAHAERDGGTCPTKTMTSDCAGWTVSGTGKMIGSSTTVGAMAPQQALNKSVAPVSKQLADCAPSSCPKTVAAPSAPSASAPTAPPSGAVPAPPPSPAPAPPR